MRPLDFQRVERGHTFVLPQFGTKAQRISALVMRSEQQEGGAGAVHLQLGDPTTSVHGEAAVARQFDAEGARDTVRATRELQPPNPKTKL